MNDRCPPAGGRPALLRYSSPCAFTACTPLGQVTIERGQTVWVDPGTARVAIVVAAGALVTLAWLAPQVAIALLRALAAV